MARLAIDGVPAVLAAAEEWRTKCLLNEGSVFGQKRLWTQKNLETLRKAYVDNPILNSSRSFYDKLREQLGTYPDEIKQLMAEMVWLTLLFPSRIGAEKKREDIKEIWEWSGQPLPANQALLGDALELGVGHAGTAFNTHRWREIRFFCELMWFHVPGRDPRYRQPQGAGVPALEHVDGRLLRRGTPGSPCEVRGTRDLQHRGVAVHQRRASLDV